jgi:hypothetical protein
MRACIASGDTSFGPCEFIVGDDPDRLDNGEVERGRLGDGGKLVKTRLGNLREGGFD